MKEFEEMRIGMLIIGNVSPHEKRVEWRADCARYIGFRFLLAAFGPASHGMSTSSARLKRLVTQEADEMVLGEKPPEH